MSETSQTAWSELQSNWRLITACTIGFGLSLSGIPFYTLGVFVDPLHAEFGWNVGAVQLGLTVSYLTTMLVLPAIGLLANRIGVRRVALVSLTLLGLAFMALSLQTGDLRLFYLNWFFIALFGTGTLAITWTRALTRALTTGRGLGLGLSLLGTGVVGIFGPSVTRDIIDAIGWRWAYVCLGAVPIMIAVPTTFLFFHDRAVAGETPPKALPARFTDSRLWLLGAIFVMYSAAVTGVVPNLIKVLTSDGLSRSDAVAAAGFVGLFVIIGRVSCGALLDRFWAPAVASIFVLMAASACLFLSTGAVQPGTAVLAAACIGLAIGAEFDLMPYLISRYIPTERYTGSLAIVSSCFYLGAAISGPALAYFFDHYGSYRIGLLGAVGLFAAAIAALLSLGPYPNLQAAQR